MRSRISILLFLAILVIGSGLAIQSTPAQASRLYSLTPSPEPPTATPIPTTVPPTAVPPTATETPIPPPPTAFPPTATTAPPATEAPTSGPPATAIPTQGPPATEIPPTSAPPATEIPPATEVPTSGPPATALPPTSVPTAAPPMTTGLADIVVTKQADQAVVHIGDPLRYTIVVENVGTALATEVQLVDTIPAWLKLINYQVSQGTASLASGTVVAQIGDLAPGARATLTIDTVVVSVGGTLANTAKGTTTTPGENPINNTSTVVVAPGGQAAPTATPRPQPAGLALASPPPEANSSLPHTAIGDALPLPLMLGLIGVVAGVVAVMIRASRPRLVEEDEG